MVRGDVNRALDIESEAIATALAAVVCRHVAGATGIADLRHLSGGANQQTWAFDAVGPSARVPLVLQRTPEGARLAAVSGVTQAAPPLAHEVEAAVLRAAAEAGVPVPALRCVLRPADALGDGFIVDRIEGESLPRRLLRDEAFAPLRSRLASECGGLLARIHRAPTRSLAGLPLLDAPAQIDRLAAAARACGPRPVFSLALRWLRERVPPAPARPVLVHGDFRNGNLIVSPEGIRAVIDWELAHLGDPMEDLGWLCINAWRFGQIDRPVGGFGRREALFEAYEAAGGGRVDPTRVRFWEVLGTLRWGLVCAGRAVLAHRGAEHDVERIATGRRASEAEIDLLDLLLPATQGERDAGSPVGA